MKERLKTFLLVSLVGLSLILTKRLWIELPNDMFGIFSRQDGAYSTSYLLSDMIMPNKYLLNFNEKNHTIFYDDSKHKIWTNTRRALVNILGSKDIEITNLPNDEFLTYNGNRSLVFYFPEKINTYILAKALDVKDPNLIVDTILNVNCIYIYLDKGDSFFVFSNGDEHITISSESIDLTKVKEQMTSIEALKDYNYYYSMKERLDIDNDIYIPYEMKNTLPTVYMENIIRTLKEDEKKDIAENFFSRDIDYIREIVEGNGSTIYIYDQRVLKLNINGTIEYFNSLVEAVKRRDLYLTLTTAAEFISRNANVPKGMYLAKVEEISIDDNLGYNLTFRYRVRGIPVILGNLEIGDIVQMEVFNDHVRTYKYYSRKDMNLAMENIVVERKMLTSFEVMDMNYEYIVERYFHEKGIKDTGIKPELNEIWSSIRDITLSYFDPCLKDIGDELIVVWVIRTEKGMYAFDVYDGSLIFENF